MIQLPCPWCGPRNVTEFRHHGEVVSRPDASSSTPREWRRYLYFRRNEAGWVEENWYHTAGCRRFFRLRRHTVSNENHLVEGTR
ncbi:MAG TPA: sarcosine oxidase subunit delta [Nocardioidaceae bacterium]|nr:sarcosine oxidase subunit delta [Nocardioidaceae bacterium]